ncbi:respiratory burst oxidase protein B-like [Trifolium pratense]|uniref:Respiratory burst oxidase protein B-like n=1 Tax=Trifolium pratense TaxID=57577 RepID=A0A2K3LXH5_TRIPR|nr:respiratory burst oxidase protein B-like [Trifolium pratense]
MEIENHQNHLHQEREIWSETESTGSRSTRVGFSGSLSGPLSGPLVTSNNKKKSSKKSARFSDDVEDYVEITLDVRDDTVSVQNIRGGDSETALLASRLEKRPSTLSVKLKQVSQELKRMTSSKKFDRVDRAKSGAARALKGLKFMTKNVGDRGWTQVEKRFDELEVDGKLPKTRFSQCIVVLVMIDTELDRENHNSILTIAIGGVVQLDAKTNIQTKVMTQIMNG